MSRSRIQLVVAIVAVLFILGAEVSAQEGTNAVEATSSLLQYQGRLRDPSSGAPLADGSYTMAFRFYAIPSGGAALWTETKDVPVRDGLFSTVLGDTAPLDQSLFNGQALWLGIKVGTDEEATPRQQVLPVAYALSLVPGAIVQADSSAAALSVNNVGSGQALHAGGPVVVEGDLTVGGDLNGGEHGHDGADITSGQVAEARISAVIARDGEVSSAINNHAADAGAHHNRYTDAEAANAALNEPEIVTEYEFKDHIYGGMHSGRAIAYGIINQFGDIASATGNVSSSWSSLWQCYEISIEGHTYDHWSYVTIAQPLFGIAYTWSIDGKLYVGIYDFDGEPIKTDFHFVTFKP